MIVKRSVNCWDMINKINMDKSLWDYLEPAEIMEIVQRANEARERIKGLEKYFHIDLTPAFQKLGSIAHSL